MTKCMYIPSCTTSCHKHLNLQSCWIGNYSTVKSFFLLLLHRTGTYQGFKFLNTTFMFFGPQKNLLKTSLLRRFIQHSLLPSLLSGMLPCTEQTSLCLSHFLVICSNCLNTTQPHSRGYYFSSYPEHKQIFLLNCHIFRKIGQTSRFAHLFLMGKRVAIIKG